MSAIRKGTLDDTMDRLKRRLDKINESTRFGLKVDDLAGEILFLKETVLDLGRIVLALYTKDGEAS